MSPTAAIVIRFVDRSGFGGGGSGGGCDCGSGETSTVGGGAGGCAMISGGCAAQPAIIDMARVNARGEGLVTEPDT